MSLEDFATAQGLEGVIRSVVRSELARSRPQARYAVVRGIDRATRSCMVTYVGEDTPVRVPYNGTGPANIGQEVRIEGARSDRVIVDVRGTTETEGRVIDLEDEIAARPWRAGRWTLETDWTAPANGVWGTIPVQRPEGRGGWPATAGLSINSSGEVRIPEDGWYMVIGSGAMDTVYMAGTRYLGIGVRLPGESSSTNSKSLPVAGGYESGMEPFPVEVSDLLWLPADAYVMLRGTGTGSQSNGSSRKFLAGASSVTMTTGISVCSMFSGPRPESDV